MRTLSAVLIAVLAAGRAMSATGAVNVPVTPAAAIERAVRDRIGGTVLSVDVDMVSATVVATASLVATPDPAARIGRASRFTLTVDGIRRGTAVATVRARAHVVRATKPIPGNVRIESDAVAVHEADLDGAPFGRVLAETAVIGSRSRRAIESGMVVAPHLVLAPFAVEHGQRVQVGVTIGQVHVTSEGTASGSGYVGDLVRVLQPGRRIGLRARIVDRGLVEVEP